MKFTIQSHTAEETKVCGKRLAALLRGGDVVCLTGNLGAGKTAFVQGVGVGLGITEAITSPTFTLIQEYAVKAPLQQASRLVHMDLYRLHHVEEAVQIGVEEAFQEDAVAIIEWPEIADEILPEDVLHIHIEGSGESPRCLIFMSEGEIWDTRLSPLFKMTKKSADDTGKDPE